MKIILTEDQLALVKLIKETTEYTERVMDAIKELKSKANKMYNVLSFTTLAEIRDGDTDIHVMKQKFEVLSNLKDDLDRKVYDFEQKNITMDGDWHKPELEKVYNDMDMRLYNLRPRLDALENLIDYMVSASEPELHKPFKDITPTEI